MIRRSQADPRAHAEARCDQEQHAHEYRHPLALLLAAVIARVRFVATSSASIVELIAGDRVSGLEELRLREIATLLHWRSPGSAG